MTDKLTVAWRPMDTAPKDGTSVQLLIEDGEHPLSDDNPSVSIGSFGVEGGPVDDPTWTFAGWCWQQDCYCRGTGTPIGWLPVGVAAQPSTAVVPLTRATIDAIWSGMGSFTDRQSDYRLFARAIERAHGITA